MVSSAVAPTAAATAASAAAVTAIASSVGSAAAALCLLAEWRLFASCVGRGGAMAVLLHSHLLAHTLYSEAAAATAATATAATAAAVPHSATAVSSHNYSAAAIVSRAWLRRPCSIPPLA